MEVGQAPGPAGRTEAEEAGREAPRLLRPFLALAYREFRLLWVGQLCQGSASFAERVTRGWLGLALTGSAFQLGALELTGGVASLLVGVWGGVLADRFEKRRLLMIIQFWTFGLYGLMAGLTLSGRLELWHLYASAIGLSLGSAVNQPVRTSFIPSLVPERLVINALSLNSIATNATRMAAPATAAALIQVTGNGGWGYMVCAILYLCVLIFTQRIRAAEAGSAPGHSLVRSLWQGWRFAASSRPVFTQLVIGLGPLTIGFTYQAMLVAYATRTLGQGAAAYGLLYSFAGLGALLGGVAVASMGGSLPRGRLLLVTGLLNGTAMLGMGALGLLPSDWPRFWAAVPCLMMAGGSQTSFRAANNGLLLASTPRELRGRIMSFDEAFRSLGTLVAPAVGALADATTPAAAMATIGAGSLLVVAAVLAWQPRLRDL